MSRTSTAAITATAAIRKWRKRWAPIRRSSRTSPTTLPVPDKLKAILRFAKVLTLEPRKISQAHADAVYAAGWDEQALHDAILVVCRFNFMNRLTLGHGLDPAPEKFATRGKSMSYNSERAGPA